MPTHIPTPLYAADLKQLFAVYGDFYRVDLGGQLYECRSVLELIAHARVPQEPNRIHSLQPDLLAIMMNPGSSRPLPPDYTPRRVGREGPGARPERVLTRPDNTQYQIMRVMVAQGWGHARVLNLSDLREPKSVQLMKTLDRLRAVAGGEQHSIFCPARREEREQLLGRRGQTPVLVGWGRGSSLLPLATLCLQALSGWRRVGVPADEAGLFYAHPSPMLQSKKDQWLVEILAQLQGESSPAGIVVARECVAPA
ncbi:MAG: hypothetical protein H7836_01460 [Magnetococcus sp. YQC-3]